MTHFGDEALSYDAGGRVTQDGERVLTWDAKGRLAKVERGDVTEEYVYDYSDTRAVKRTTTDGNTEVVRYIDKDAEERDGKLVRYVFFQDQRLARLDALGGESQGALEPGAVPPPAGTGWTLPPLPGAWRLLPLWLGLAALFVAVAWGRRVEAFAHHLSDLLRAHPLRGPPLLGDRRVWRWSAVFAVVAAMAPGCKCGSDGGKSDAKPITELPADAVLYLADFQGSPLITTNALGAVTKETAYHPYGSVRSERGDEADPWAFVGNEADSGSGLGDFKARAYRAEAGVFLSPDPVGVFESESILETPEKLGAFAYASGDPIGRVDRDGRLPWGVIAIAAGTGAVANVAGLLVSKAITGDSVTPSEVGGATAGGTIAGLSSLGGPIVGFFGGAGGAAVEDAIAGRPQSGVNILVSGVANAVAPAIGKGIGGFFARGASRGGVTFAKTALFSPAVAEVAEQAARRETARTAVQGTASGVAVGAYGRLAQDPKVQNVER